MSTPHREPAGYRDWPRDQPAGYTDWYWRDWPTISCLVRGNPMFTCTPIADIANGTVAIQTLRRHNAEDFTALSRLILAKLAALGVGEEAKND